MGSFKDVRSKTFENLLTELNKKYKKCSVTLIDKYNSPILNNTTLSKQDREICTQRNEIFLPKKKGLSRRGNFWDSEWILSHFCVFLFCSLAELNKKEKNTKKAKIHRYPSNSPSVTAPNNIERK